MTINTIMRLWLRENHDRISAYPCWSGSADMGGLTILYYQGFRVGWMTDTEFAIRKGNHYSTMGNFEILNPADPNFFNVVNDRLKQIGA